MSQKYTSSSWATKLWKRYVVIKPFFTETRIFFRNRLSLGENAINILRMGIPSRVFRHSELDLEVYYYADKKLGEQRVKLEALSFNGKFSGAIYYLGVNLPIDDLKKVIEAKYVTSVGNIQELENFRIVDKFSGQLILLKLEFSSVVIYVNEGFFEELIDKLNFEAELKSNVTQEELFAKLFSEI